jgi:hypothetical protein
MSDQSKNLLLILCTFSPVGWHYAATMGWTLDALIAAVTTYFVVLVLVLLAAMLLLPFILDELLPIALDIWEALSAAGSALVRLFNRPTTARPR